MYLSVNIVSLKIKMKRKKNCNDNVHSRVCQIIIITHRYLRRVATVLAAAATAAAVETAPVHRRCMESALDYACLIERLSLLIVSCTGRTHRRRQRTPVGPQWSGPCRWQSPDDSASGPRRIRFTAALCRRLRSPTTTRQTVFHSVVITTELHGTDVNCSCRLRYFLFLVNKDMFYIIYRMCVKWLRFT